MGVPAGQTCADGVRARLAAARGLGCPAGQSALTPPPLPAGTGAGWAASGRRTGAPRSSARLIAIDSGTPNIAWSDVGAPDAAAAAGRGPPHPATPSTPSNVLSPSSGGLRDLLLHTLSAAWATRPAAQRWRLSSA